MIQLSQVRPSPHLWRGGQDGGTEGIGMTQENDHKNVIFGIFCTIILVLTPSTLNPSSP
jgi:hypothetical protein